MFSKVTLVGLLQAVATVTVFLSVVTGIGIAHHNIELFSHFRLQYLIASVLLALVFSIYRQPTYAITLLLTAGFNASLVLPWYFATDPTSSGTPLKLIHVNVLASNTEYQRLIDFVHAESPDIVFLQEITPQWSSGMAALLQDYPYSHTAARHGSFGIAVYSRIPFETVTHVDSPPQGYPTIIATIAVADETLTLISTHPTVPTNRTLYERRNEQLRSIVETINQISGKVVLLGDFNASIWDPHYRNLETATGLRNTRRGMGVLPTWPTYLPIAMIPIDHALVSDGMGVVETRTGTNIGSDHLPLVVSITMCLPDAISGHCFH